MRTSTPKLLEAGRDTTSAFRSDASYGLTGRFFVRTPRGLSPGGIPTTLRVLSTDPASFDRDDLDVMGWEHVSVSVESQRRTPTYEEMAWVKRLFWQPTEAACQFHVPDAEHVNNAEALHLWRHVSAETPRPSTALVGTVSPCRLAGHTPFESDFDAAQPEVQP